MIEIIIYAVLAAWAFVALLWLVDRVTGSRRRAESEEHWKAICERNNRAWQARQNRK